jgi:hypothetical protein
VNRIRNPFRFLKDLTATMSQIVEIKLRIPSLTIPGEKRTNNELVRFTTRLECAAVPKAGEALDVPINADVTLSCVAVRSTWDDRKDSFIVECQFAQRRISPADYRALVQSPDWTMTQLGS